MRNQSVANGLSIAAAILLLFFTAIGNSTLMVVASGIVIVTGLLYFTGKMRRKIFLSVVLGMGVAFILARVL